MKKDFFSNKIINTLKIINEICAAISEPRNSHFEYYLPQHFSRATHKPPLIKYSKYSNTINTQRIIII